MIHLSIKKISEIKIWEKNDLKQQIVKLLGACASKGKAEALCIGMQWNYKWNLRCVVDCCNTSIYITCICMTFKFITDRVPHTQWTITLDLHLWQRLQHMVGSQQWVLLAYTMFAQTNRGCFCWATAHWTQWPRSPSSPLPSKQSFLLSAEHCSVWELCMTERKALSSFLHSL